MNREYNIKFWTGISVLAIAVLMMIAVQVKAHGPPGYNDLQLNSSKEINNNDYLGYMVRGYMGCH